MLKQIAVVKLREAVRHFIPESRGAGGIGNTGNKEQLLTALREAGIMDSEVLEFINLGAVSGDSTTTKEQPSTPPSHEELSPSNDLDVIRDILTRGIRPNLDMDMIGKMIDDKLKSAVNIIEIKKPNQLNKPIGICHQLTETIAKVCNLGIHQMLVGPAGGGKTTCCEKVAQMLDLDFFPMSMGPQTTKSDLLGFIDAGGRYHPTQLRRAFEDGGLLLLDEVDAANAGVLTIINSMLANGYCSFPDGVIAHHDNFRCICACNTYGRGADREYVGRNQLDAATLDRFVVQDFDYDEKMELAIANNPKWVAKVQKYRKRAFELKVRLVISPRASINGARLLADGLPENLVEEITIWKGVASEIRKKVIG